MSACADCVRVCLRADDGGDDSRGELGEAGGDEASHTRSSRTLLGAGACGGGWGTEREAAAVVERSARPSPRGPHAVRCERCPLRSALQCSWRATGYGVLLALGERVAPFFHSFLPSAYSNPSSSGARDSLLCPRTRSQSSVSCSHRDRPGARGKRYAPAVACGIAGLLRGASLGVVIWSTSAQRASQMETLADAVAEKLF